MVKGYSQARERQKGSRKHGFLFHYEKATSDLQKYIAFREHADRDPVYASPNIFHRRFLQNQRCKNFPKKNKDVLKSEPA
ncbi:unnamed protein product [Dovyalis caffra]|uniref:Uncharacterized protein n=1 Tax=Dovyalis caffra TaxID=77055 RepID=A0AAV1RRH5_9ROSI|nr:unnamed protein product [Dovyalis caffra]